MTQIAPRWTPEQDAILTAGLLEHKSHRQIAAIIGKTKNSCCARAMRLRDKAGISLPKHIATPQKPRTNGRGHTDNAIRAKLRQLACSGPPRLPSVPMATFTERFSEGYEGQTGRVSIVELTAGVCRFPVDQPKGPVRYCGLPANRSVYCPSHAVRMAQP